MIVEEIFISKPETLRENELANVGHSIRLLKSFIVDDLTNRSGHCITAVTNDGY